MIQYTLKCEKEHTFDSWFQSSSAFEKLKANEMIVCSICGSSNIEKAIMAPRVNKNTKLSIKKKNHPAEQAIAEIKKHVEENSHCFFGYKQLNQFSLSPKQNENWFVTMADSDVF